MKNDLASVKAVAITESVNFPFFTKNISDQDEFIANEVSEKAAKTMLDELARWTGALKVLR